MPHDPAMAGIIGFPNPVNEKAARVVAALVAVSCLVTLVSGWHWLLVPIAYGFWARVLTGPRLSPYGLLATRVLAPRLGPAKLVPGPPKRFAQTIGAVVTTTAAVSSLVLGWTTFTNALLVMMVVFATLESALAFCVGCRIFALLMRVGVIPESVCVACNDITSRAPVAAGGAVR